MGPLSGLLGGYQSKFPSVQFHCKYNPEQPQGKPRRRMHPQAINYYLIGTRGPEPPYSVSFLCRNVTSVVVDSSNRVLVGCLFSQYQGRPAPGIARLNVDGSVDKTFVYTGSGLSGSVMAITMDRSGRIVVGGSFIMGKQQTFAPPTSMDCKAIKTGLGVVGD